MLSLSLSAHTILLPLRLYLICECVWLGKSLNAHARTHFRVQRPASMVRPFWFGARQRHSNTHSTCVEMGTFHDGEYVLASTGKVSRTHQHQGGGNQTRVS